VHRGDREHAARGGEHHPREEPEDAARGEPGAARPLLEQALRSARARADRMVTCVALVDLARVALAEDRVDDAEAHLVECLGLAGQMRTLVNLEVALSLLAVSSSTRRRWRTAAVLLGAAHRMGTVLGAPIHESYLLDPLLLDGTERAVRTALGEEVYEEAFGSGDRMSRDDVARFVATSVPRRG
jgi:hypothetical protein